MSKWRKFQKLGRKLTDTEWQALRMSQHIHKPCTCTFCEGTKNSRAYTFCYGRNCKKRWANYSLWRRVLLRLAKLRVDLAWEYRLGRY